MRNLVPRLRRETLAVMEALAAFDQRTFKFLAGHTASMRVYPISPRDPLDTTANPDDVATIAATIGEMSGNQATSHPPGLDHYHTGLVDIGGEYGLVVVPLSNAS